MSKENVQKFYEMLQQDPAAVEELKKGAEKIEGPEMARTFVIAFAKEKGFEFTAEDMAALESEIQKELSIEELDKITGGSWGLCWGFGIGWGDAEGPRNSETHCLGFGFGIGYADKEYPEPKK